MIAKKGLEKIAPADNRPAMELKPAPAGNIQVYFKGRDYTGRRGDLFPGCELLPLILDPAVSVIVDNETGEILHEKGVYYI